MTDIESVIQTIVTYKDAALTIGALILVYSVGLIIVHKLLWK